MRWTVRDPPRDMQALPSNVRAKAVAIANELVDEGENEATAVRVAIGRAKRWSNRQAKLGRMKRGKAPPRRRREPQRGRKSRRVAHARDWVGSR